MKFLFSFLFVFTCWCTVPPAVFAASLVEVTIQDRDYLVVHVADGEIIHHEGSQGDEVIRYTPELDTAVAMQPARWLLTSSTDSAYGSGGQHPVSCSRKKKLSGHGEFEWSTSDNDFRYEYTYDHWIYLQLPSSLQQNQTYSLTIDASTNIDSSTIPLTFDVSQSRSEAIHINLVGYSPDAPLKAADLYAWMGDGAARNYTSFEGNGVSVLNVNNGSMQQVGTVQFWKQKGTDTGWVDMTGSDVWSIDLSSLATPGTYRLVVEGVGSSRDFTIGEQIYHDPFMVSLRGYFYMRLGESNPKGITPAPRTPLLIPGDADGTTVYLTSMQPYHNDWNSFSSGDQWDKPSDWAAYLQNGSPTNTNAWGGHSDAADLDRHLRHVANIYHLLLPYLLTNGRLDDDNTGITESGNGIPDLLDEARYEVDFWLRLRDGQGYSHGLTNPTSGFALYQAGATPIAAWANAANAAMLADAFRLAGNTTLMEKYRDAAVQAFTYASSLADPMLDQGLNLDDGLLRGRDLKMMAAAHLYTITGDQRYEDIVYAESVCAAAPATLMDNTRNQLFATAAYLNTPQTVHYEEMQGNMRTQIIQEAKTQEADLMTTRPSRRATDQRPSYWTTAHFMTRTLIAHAICTTAADKEYFRQAMDSEASWSLGRNPLNMIQMTTTTTPLSTKRSVPDAYTSGRYDGVSGVHPGHTPYMNLNDWAPAMVMGRPSALYKYSYPADVPSIWPRGETYFPSRWVWAHNEFTPRQTMSGKMALYGYLYALDKQSTTASSSTFPWPLILPALFSSE
ncbi:cellulase N-terminal Ig-like domain-containing protein [Desulfogranum japonicum]|uniref:cellulase N-terminal Ig-like domain-containing protein n=1 Tax=Desulfogranum japonicum TaxID=231447 RepID=UPI000426B306|nr:cellulase N-terminal Ig-like domain-containing protein [Desulfogranum japonicum]